jgi:tRNA-dihydrouridine synthase A
MIQNQTTNNPVEDLSELGSTPNYAPGRFSIAPMLDWTDRHCRYFHRLMTSQTLLYTEMITTGAIIHGRGDYLAYNQEEHPVSLQLGGSNPLDLAKSAKIAAERGYDEINLNVGCPSDRVQSGRFGACLMAEPTLVADCVKAMQDVVDIPITVKTRIGIDEQDSYEFLQQFIETVAATGCNDFTLHARKAWLSGLSPKENREIPELNYQRVYDIKKAYPELFIAINGGVKSLAETALHLEQLDGVMMGREAYHNPYLLNQVDELVFGGERSIKTRHDIAELMLPYIDNHIRNGGSLTHIYRHMLGLFLGLPGARAWKRYLSEEGHKKGAGVEVVEAALKLVPRC